jgi:hypothetical protein
MCHRWKLMYCLLTFILRNQFPSFPFYLMTVPPKSPNEIHMQRVRSIHDVQSSTAAPELSACSSYPHSIHQPPELLYLFRNVDRGSRNGSYGKEGFKITCPELFTLFKRLFERFPFYINTR